MLAQHLCFFLDLYRQFPGGYDDECFLPFVLLFGNQKLKNTEHEGGGFSGSGLGLGVHVTMFSDEEFEGLGLNRHRGFEPRLIDSFLASLVESEFVECHEKNSSLVRRVCLSTVYSALVGSILRIGRGAGRSTKQMMQAAFRATHGRFLQVRLMPDSSIRTDNNHRSVAGIRKTHRRRICRADRTCLLCPIVHCKFSIYFSLTNVDRRDISLPGRWFRVP